MPEPTQSTVVKGKSDILDLNDFSDEASKSESELNGTKKTEANFEEIGGKNYSEFDENLTKMSNGSEIKSVIEKSCKYYNRYFYILINNQHTFRVLIDHHNKKMHYRN